MRNSIRWSLVLAVAIGYAGCGGGAEETSEPEPVADTTGDEAPLEDDVEPEPEPSGPGQLTVVNRVGGEDAGGTVQVLSMDGEVVAEGESGQTFNVDSGEYRITGQVTDAAVLIDTPTHEADRLATVVPGETATAENNFPRSRILIEVRRRNRPVRTWRLTVTRDGRDAGEEIVLEPSSEHTPISPGRYTGRLRTGNSEIEVSGLIFQGGATMTVPVNVD